MKRIMFAVFAVSAVFCFVSCAKKAQVNIASAEDLNGKKIGCQAGTTGETYIQEEVKGATLKSSKTGMDAALDLKNGAIDAIVLDELPAKEIVKRNPSLKVLDIRFATEEYAIAVKKGNTALLDSINKTVSSMKADGTYEKLVKAFMPADGDIVIPPSIPLKGSEIIKMGTNAAFPPFEYIEGTDPVGFDVTMSEMIARDFGKKLQVVDMAFDGLIAALQSDAIDFIAAGMTATAERRKNVDFSEPYYSSNQVIIVRK